MNNNCFNKEIESELNLGENIISTEGYKLNSTTKEIINNTLLNTLGISYDEFDKLDFDYQQRIIREYHKKNFKSRAKSKNLHVMIGNGEHSIFIKVKKGERVMIGFGEYSCFVEAGLTPEKSRIRLDDKLDDVIYSKPVALVKKMVRRIKR